MIEIYLLEQLSAFARCGTLSAAAEELHISQPALSRSMKKIEEELGVSLFEREKSRIRLNKTGELASQLADEILNINNGMVRTIRDFDRKSRTISVGSCEVFCISEIVSRLRELFASSTIASEIKDTAPLTEGLQNDLYDLIILPNVLDGEKYVCKKIGEEHLCFSLDKNHKFAGRKSLTFKEMNGENMLLFSEIGFWKSMVDSKMPDSHFLIQSERYTLDELITNSSLPCFTTDKVVRTAPNRVNIPVADSEAHPEFYLVCKRENKNRYAALFK